MYCLFKLDYRSIALLPPRPHSASRPPISCTCALLSTSFCSHKEPRGWFSYTETGFCWSTIFSSNPCDNYNMYTVCPVSLCGSWHSCLPFPKEGTKLLVEQHTMLEGITYSLLLHILNGKEINRELIHCWYNV